MIKGLIKSSPRSGYFVLGTQNEDHGENQEKTSPVARDELFMKNMMLTSKRISEISSFNTAARVIC
jgi:hypothetical protein